MGEDRLLTALADLRIEAERALRERDHERATASRLAEQSGELLDRIYELERALIRIEADTENDWLLLLARSALLGKSEHEDDVDAAWAASRFARRAS